VSPGKIIKFLRCEHGLTQDELGKILEVKKSSIQKYESNEVPNLKIGTIRKLSQKFGISPSAFIFPEHYRYLDLKDVVKYNDDLQEHHTLLLYALNKEGKEKVFQYARDLVDSGNYKD
jgi:transcriptional regulator with XRE-family HTH domain